MEANDFDLLAKFVAKKAKGSTLTFKSDTSHKLEITLALEDGDNATIEIFAGENVSFPKINRKRNLGDEL